jgi:uncharacterized membrane protein
MAILLALGSALAYGVSDFIGGIASRRTSAWAIAVAGTSTSAVCTSLAALVVSAGASPTSLTWGAVAGLGGGMGTGFLYRGFAVGRMSVVAPVSAVGAAVVPVLAGVATGERPSLVVWIGVVVAMPGIWLVSSAPEHPGSSDPDSNRAATGRWGLPEGLIDAVLAGIGFGLLFAALGQVPHSAGLWPLALSQLVAVPTVVLTATLLRGQWVPRGRRPVGLGALSGALGASATGSFLLAAQHGFLTVAGVLASLYPATTVVLAALVLRERIHRSQGIGLGLCALAIALVAGG